MTKCAKRHDQVVSPARAANAVYISNQEIPFPDDCVIVSRTDPNGIITHANQTFVEISGYSLDELLGAKHSLLRHPDMPAGLFEEMWCTITQLKRWHGYLKNRCKNGDHYWVKATVMPNVRQGHLIGYTSVRKKPSRAKVAEQEILLQAAHVDG